jgi:hypothetical protein
LCQLCIDAASNSTLSTVQLVSQHIYEHHHTQTAHALA